ncbi:MAG: arylesterase [Roseovarius sp.]|uniref:arylesterase n=1 Tax=Roseovarius sp. TaxID=1486281 RepID=UPI001B4B2042|nr:arylesterase [Roseovarius sp.]MBQ0751288.1 arylesterase [Roseovarius sp.]MBQ0811393.1 arylesterase [Roseovarius sp.]
MRLRLIYKGFLSYGVRWPLGKVVVAFLSLVSPVMADEPVTVLALGDSLTQGYGLPEQDGLVPQMQKWLEDQGVEARLINAGVSGDTTAGGAARVEWSLTPEVDAMIVALGGNDLLRGIDPAVSRGNLEAILQVAEAKGVEVLLVGLKAPGNYGADYKTSFDAIYPDLSEAYGAILAPDFFAGLGGGDPAALQEWFQADGIHPNAKGVARIVDGLGPQVRDLIEAARATE